MFLRVAGGVALTFLLVLRCAARQFEFPGAAADDPVALAAAMPSLAKQVLAEYHDPDRAKYLDSEFRLQIVAGDYAAGLKSLAELHSLRGKSDSAFEHARDVQYEAWTRAKIDSSNGSSFEDAFRRSLGEALAALDDRTSNLVIRALGTDQSTIKRAVQESAQQQKGKEKISLPDALTLIAAYQVEQCYQTITPLSVSVIEEDDQRRYLFDKDVTVKTPDGGTLCSYIMRPRKASGRLPTLLMYTIYVDPAYATIMNEIRRSASNGYVGIVGFVRGKGCSPDQPVPYERDVADIATLIDWIAAQEWSDGRVGMYGGSYTGGTTWAAAKRMPEALKAIMVGAPVAPGIDVPMEGNVFWSFVYPWPFYTLNNKTLDDATYNDNARWRKLNRDWYTSGRAYRDLDKIDAMPNPFFDRWISHPSYDAYWRNMIPYQQEFARINIPVLTTAGYYFGGPGAAMYYLTEHYKYNPKAEHYLVIGPYDHFQGQRGTINALGVATRVINGYTTDPVAQIDLGEMRYQWFDHVFKGTPKPAMLADRINYQVTGANVWKHAPSITAMSSATMRLHLSATKDGASYRFAREKPRSEAFVSHTVNLADRSDIDVITAGGGVLDKAIDTSNGVEFVSEPLAKVTEMSGLFSGELDFVVNKKDFDFEIDLYELTPKGEYFQLPPFWTRASYVEDRAQRHLLTPGKRQHLKFKSIRLISHQLQAGSRVVMVLSVIKEPGRQINYGTGKDVSDETIADAKEPLQIKWFNDSFIDLPVR